MVGDRPGDPSGVIFDIDGTLMDTLDDLTNAVNVLLEEIGRPTVSREHVGGMIGEGLSIFLKRASGIDDPEIITKLAERYRPLYFARLLDHTKLYPGIPMLLDALTAADMPMGILSNKPHIYTVPLCDALLNRWPFVRIQGTVDRVPKKPDPTAALVLANEMNRPPANVYFVGDSNVDVETARRAGMIPLAVTWGYGDHDELIAANPALLADTPEQVVKLLVSDPGR